MSTHLHKSCAPPKDERDKSQLWWLHRTYDDVYEVWEWSAEDQGWSPPGISKLHLHDTPHIRCFDEYAFPGYDVVGIAIPPGSKAEHHMISDFIKLVQEMRGFKAECSPMLNNWHERAAHLVNRFKHLIHF